MKTKVCSISKNRERFLFLLIGIFFIFLGFNLVKVQIIGHTLYLKKAKQQYLKEIPLISQRGIIYDRNMKPLVLNMETFSLYGIPSLIDATSQVVKKISHTLDIPENIVFRKLSEAEGREGYFYYLFRKIDKEKADLIRSLKIDGVGIYPENKRYYPGECFASHILGFTNVDVKGVGGVEQFYDYLLVGIDGRLKTEKAPQGIIIPEEFLEKFGKREHISPLDGKSIVLTIDEYIQSVAERELVKAKEMTQARGGTVIVMEPKTGEVLAMANFPNFNPNFPHRTPKHFKRNNAISFVFEPGSVFKVFLAASAIQEKIVSSSTRFNCGGSISIEKHTINDHDGKVHGTITVEDIIKHSCNIGVVQIAQKLGKEKFYNSLVKFGFGKKTGIDLSAEEKGIMTNYSSWREINLANIAFGQGIAVTPLQLLSGFCAIINGGDLISPRIVRAVLDKGELKKETRVKIIRKNVIDEEAGKQMKKIMLAVVEEGTGKKAKIDGYKIGGKTGTAQKAAYGRYIKGHFISSFVGFAPVDDPKIAILVVIDEPRVTYYASEIACPVFREIARETLLHLGVAPQEITLAQAPSN